MESVRRRLSGGHRAIHSRTLAFVPLAFDILAALSARSRRFLDSNAERVSFRSALQPAVDDAQLYQFSRWPPTVVNMRFRFHGGSLSLEEPLILRITL